MVATYVLLGSVCWMINSAPGMLNQEKCGNIYENEESRHTSLESCLNRAEYLGTLIQSNRKKKGSYVTEMTIKCIPSTPTTTYSIRWQ
jgi:hypothetical protein